MKRTLALALAIVLVLTGIALPNSWAIPPAYAGTAYGLEVDKTANPDTIFLDGQGSPNKSTVTLTLTGTGETGPGPGIDIVFALDSSGSMNFNDPDDIRKTGAMLFVDELRDDLDQAGVVSWDDNVDFYQELNNDFDQVKYGNGDPPSTPFGIEDVDSDGGTNLQPGLDAAIQLLDYGKMPESAHYIVFLSDGYDYYWEQSNRNPLPLAEDAAAKEYVIHTIGLGDQADEYGLLTEMANITGGNYYHADEANDLLEVYDNIADEVMKIPATDLIVTDVLQSHIVLKGDFSIEPDSITPNADGTTTLVWTIDELRVGQQWTVSFDVGSTITGAEVPVDVEGADNSRVGYIDHQGNSATMIFPQAYLRVEPVACTLITFANPAEGGTVTGGGDYEYGTAAQLEAIPANSNWHFSHWEGDLNGTDNPTSIVMEGDKIVTAVFEQYEYLLSIDANPTEGGSVVGGGTYAGGTTVQIGAIPTEPCWYFTGWTGDSVQDPTSPATSILIDGDKSIVANFDRYAYTLTVIADPSDAATVTGAGSFDCGSDVPITATPNQCWSFSGWSGDGIADPDALSTTVLVDGDKTVTAHFVKTQYTLSVDADPSEGGTVTGAGTFDCGSDAPISASPNQCWSFTGWSGDGIADPTSPSTTVLVDSDKTVTAHFERAQCTLTVVADPPEGGTATGGGTYDCGTVATVATVSASPNEGFVFDHWSNNVIVPDPEHPDIGQIMMDSDNTVTAYFIPALKADFTAEVSRCHVCWGYWVVQFTDISSGGSSPYTYAWDFGDGITSEEQNPKHVYRYPGRYSVRLTITDSQGNTDTIVKDVIVGWSF